MKHLLMALAVLCSQLTYAQNTFRAIVKNEKSKETLTGATAHIQALNIGASSDSTGTLQIRSIPNGRFTIKFSYVGYQGYEKTFSFPLINPQEVFTIDLEPAGTELGK